MTRSVMTTMTVPHNCPLCNHTCDGETNLRVHLEVNHRKSELASLLIDRDDRPAGPRVKVSP